MLTPKVFANTFSGRATELAFIEAGAIVRHEDVRAWGAPSECHSDVTASYHAERADFFNRIGMTPDEFWAEMERRTSAKWCYFGWQNLVDRLAWQLSPFHDDPSERLDQMSLDAIIQPSSPLPEEHETSDQFIAHITQQQSDC